jgi:hypothetical protein
LSGEREIWKALFERVWRLEKVSFGTLEGAFGKSGDFHTKLKVTLRGTTAEGKLGAWNGKLGIWWVKREGEWLIRLIENLELKEMVCEKPFFSDVLGRVLRSPEDLERAQHSVHDQYVRDVFFTGETKFSYPRHYWNYIATWDSLDQHTSVSVVDFDEDGWDDFYVTARWGRNQLWRNRGDGTFEEVAQKVGLDLDGVCNCSLFADFDNDGDKDVFIGRSLERGRFFINVGGVFVDRTEENVIGGMPYWTSAMSSADYILLRSINKHSAYIYEKPPSLQTPPDEDIFITIVIKIRKKRTITHSIQVQAYFLRNFLKGPITSISP